MGCRGRAVGGLPYEAHSVSVCMNVTGGVLWEGAGLAEGRLALLCSKSAGGSGPFLFSERLDYRSPRPFSF